MRTQKIEKNKKKLLKSVQKKNKIDSIAKKVQSENKRKFQSFRVATTRKDIQHTVHFNFTIILSTVRNF